MISSLKRKKFKGIERRISKRFPFWSVISFNEINENAFDMTNVSIDIFGSSVNISEEGMLIECYEKIAPGSILSINIHKKNNIENKSNLTFIGKVMHLSKLEHASIRFMGIKFLKKPMNFNEMISNLSNN